MSPLFWIRLRSARRATTFAIGLGAMTWAVAPAGSQAPPPTLPPQGAPAEQATIEEAGWLERLLFNTRERTRRGLAAIESERPTEAVEPFRSAGRLAPTDPLVQFNAGTAELVAQETAQQDPNPPGAPNAPQSGVQRSLPSLSFAADNSTGDLAPIAHYNLGNAHLSLDDPTAALEAFKDSLRADPENADAKVNLEIALRELEKQKQEEQQQQQESEEPSEQNDEQGEDQNQAQQPGDEPRPEQPEDQNEEQGEDQQQEQQPDFEEQPDMTAEQAAAILEAVENLEREQRRLEAAEKARKASKQGKDW